MTGIDRRNLLKVGATAAAFPTISRAASLAKPAPRTSFTPGAVWFDTAGKPIQVRGSSIIKVADTYYWYGENKERTTGKDRIWHWGMRCYSSPDLYNWTDLGTFIPPDLNDTTSPLSPFQFADRPHILFNKATGKFVCWIKMLDDPYQTRCVLVADKITGPYKLIKRGIRPLGMSAGDFDLVVCPDDGKAYMYFERVHSEMIVADLTDDYTDFTGHYTTHLPRNGPPEVREGLAWFKRGTKHYLASSGTTGYFPNPSEIAVAETYHGPWTTLGGLDQGDTSETSFNSQISSVFKHSGKQDLYIAIADRWMGPLSGPEFESGNLSRKVRKSFFDRFVSHRTDVEDDLLMKLYGGLNVNTSLGRHVWLPIRFDGDRPFITWRDEWSLDEFV
ncbi:MAG: family 43 glycosylhydrolase [Novosphingobium sp.]